MAVDSSLNKINAFSLCMCVLFLCGSPRCNHQKDFWFCRKQKPTGLPKTLPQAPWVFFVQRNHKGYFAVRSLYSNHLFENKRVQPYPTNRLRVVIHWCIDDGRSSTSWWLSQPSIYIYAPTSHKMQQFLNITQTGPLEIYFPIERMRFSTTMLPHYRVSTPDLPLNLCFFAMLFVGVFDDDFAPSDPKLDSKMLPAIQESQGRKTQPNHKGWYSFEVYHSPLKNDGRKTTFLLGPGNFSGADC